MDTWIVFVDDGNGNAHRVKTGHAHSATEASVQVLRLKPWISASDILCVCEAELFDRFVQEAKVGGGLQSVTRDPRLNG